MFGDGKFEWQLLLPSFDEAFKAIFDLSTADVAVIVGGALWLFVLLLSLQSIDRRDVATGLTYMLFMTAAGVFLLLALPATIRGSLELTSGQAVAVPALALAAGGRWLWRRDAHPPRESEETP
jgi:hypothetical protein